MNYQSSLSVRPLSIPPLSYVMASTYTFEVAKHSMDYIFEKDRDYSYRCSEVNSMGATYCKRERKSERLDSFFAQSHLSYDVVMQEIYYWLNRIPRMTMGVMLDVSPETIRHLIASIHQLIQMDLTNNDMRIGGIDVNSQFIIVEIDESKFGKRKHHQRHRVEGVWVLGSTEKTAERKTFLVTVPQRDAATLLQAVYGGLSSVVDMNYTHRTVNHNVEYVISDGLWNGIKMNCKARL
ncbi:hypothetical protein PHYBLDRAFT_148305 [Phycomyces blakesleeanus NRRL 1555(-)]|uniref:ISXO2-like transposase domain-containing protein n=1 Tax=Phycomyces blakesleeanus (strain ATCC 8743b / DSM 1359 / FGSC 10004 / NBRC 33097 / NRRL 1555) TaxID=763407 RepID=A0A167LTT9_PHYB8|nr:hypothetical protein PHYBLDRAFT_148305 [Phycomyces blakesleeanus NRRL 1555(-)]OAD71088.1 hypothetical protein PHYBLDRAFT_148305 [Phycomyces blakesleeanus NRRL 1555(-)]|eukprot:XP_018289128.1 hypothetical protein PHYBLDRAFT_148305 [Phycomyces blakesleeanus NRRL 1555(-)]